MFLNELTHEHECHILLEYLDHQWASFENFIKYSLNPRLKFSFAPKRYKILLRTERPFNQALPTKPKIILYSMAYFVCILYACLVCVCIVCVVCWYLLECSPTCRLSGELFVLSWEVVNQGTSPKGKFTTSWSPIIFLLHVVVFVEVHV